jgi:tetratricopeptide (TPR) repeat protein
MQATSRICVFVLAVGLALSTVLAVHAVDTVTSEDAPDLSAVRAKLKAKDHEGALADLDALVDKFPHADVYNLMGFAFRKLGDFTRGLTFYRKALELDPDHRSALEYLGELYVETGELAKAREMLARLEKLCPQGCEEREDLAKAIAEAPASPPAK